jgi:hypothetical protein
MAVQPQVARSHEAFVVVQRCVCWTVGIAAVIFGLVGTAEWPVVGTFFGALTGAAAGAVLGLANGVMLAALTAVSSSRRGARLVTAATTLGCAVVAADVTDAAPRWDWMLPLAVGVVLAAAIGPFAAFGVQPVVLGPWFRRWTVRDLMIRILVGGALAGAALGGLSGLVIGAITYLPTVPFAVVEGGVLGSVSGVLIALIVVAAVVAPKLRVRR